MRDYSQPGDPYGISEYTAQSADTDTESKQRPSGDKSVLFKSLSVEWATPDAVYKSLDQEFRFDFDPCPLGGQVDGSARLLNSWHGKRVFCNPPYGPGIAQFLECARDAELAVFLIPSRTDTRWFHDLVLPFAREVRFIRGRLKFGNAKHNAPFPSMVVVYSTEGQADPRGNTPCAPRAVPTQAEADAITRRDQ